jgi:hypothetical protein
VQDIVVSFPCSFLALLIIIDLLIDGVPFRPVPSAITALKVVEPFWKPDKSMKCGVS